MPKYYNAKEDADGNYVSANHTRYSVIETVPIIYPNMSADRDLFLALFPV